MHTPPTLGHAVAPTPSLLQTWLILLRRGLDDLWGHDLSSEPAGDETTMHSPCL